VVGISQRRGVLIPDRRLPRCIRAGSSRRLLIEEWEKRILIRAGIAVLSHPQEKQEKENREENAEQGGQKDNFHEKAPMRAHGRQCAVSLESAPHFW